MLVSILGGEETGRYIWRGNFHHTHTHTHTHGHTQTHTRTHTHTPAESELLVEAASGVHKSLNGTILISFAGVTEERERERSLL